MLQCSLYFDEQILFIPQEFWHIQCLWSVLSYAKWRLCTRGTYWPSKTCLFHFKYECCCGQLGLHLYISPQVLHDVEKVTQSTVFKTWPQVMHSSFSGYLIWNSCGWNCSHSEYSHLQLELAPTAENSIKRLNALKYEFQAGYLKAADISDKSFLQECSEDGPTICWVKDCLDRKSKEWPQAAPREV